MSANANRASYSARSNAYRVALILAVVIFGMMTTAGVLSFASHFRSGGEVALLTALLGLPMLVLMFAALRHAASSMGNFVFSSLRWWHILWMLALVSALVFRIRDVSAITSDPLDGWAMFRVAVDIVVAFVLLARLALRRTHWVGSMLHGALGALTVFGLVCLASTAWSVYPSWTFFKSWEYLTDLALLAAILETLATTEDYRNLFNWTWALYGLLLLSVWNGMIWWPQKALYGEIVARGDVLGFRLAGVLPAFSSNDVGTYAAIIALLSLARLFPTSQQRFNKPWYGLLLLIGMAMIVMAQTRTAIAGMLFGGFFILLFSKRGKLGAVFAFVFAPILALCTMGGLILSFLERGETKLQLATLSSRADWWHFAWETFLDRPIVGLGAYAAGRFAVLAKIGQGQTSSLHSDYLDVLVGTSIWGMIPFIVAVAATWWLLLRYVRSSSLDPQDRQLAYEGLVILALLTFRSFFSDAFTWHPPLPFLAILGFVEYLRLRRKAAVQAKPRPFPVPRVREVDPQLELVFESRDQNG